MDSSTSRSSTSWRQSCREPSRARGCDATDPAWTRGPCPLRGARVLGGASRARRSTRASSARVRKLGLAGKRAYDLRYTFGTEMYCRTHDPLVVQQFDAASFARDDAPLHPGRGPRRASEGRGRGGRGPFGWQYRLAVPCGHPPRAVKSQDRGDNSGSLLLATTLEWRPDDKDRADAVEDLAAQGIAASGRARAHVTRPRGHFVPIEMRERYGNRRSASRVDGTATYTRFRRWCRSTSRHRFATEASIAQLVPVSPDC